MHCVRPRNADEARGFSEKHHRRHVEEDAPNQEKLADERLAHLDHGTLVKRGGEGSTTLGMSEGQHMPRWLLRMHRATASRMVSLLLFFQGFRIAGNRRKAVFFSINSSNDVSRLTKKPSQ